MPTRYRRNQGFDPAQAAASGLTGLVEGIHLKRQDLLAQQRFDLYSEENARRNQEIEAKIQAAAEEQAKREALRGAFERARTVKAQALEAEKTRATGMPIYERQRVDADIAKRKQDIELLGSVIQTLPFDNRGDIEFAMQELHGLEQREVMSEEYARAEVELTSAMGDGSDENPGLLPEGAGEWWLEKLRTPKSQGGVTPQEVLKYIETTRNLKAQMDAKMVGRDEVLATAQTIRQGTMPKGQRRTNFDTAVSKWQSGLWQKIDPDTFEGLLRVAATVDEPWASLILEPYGLGQGEAVTGPAPQGGPMAPQQTPSPVGDRVATIVQAVQANPNVTLAELGIDPESLTPDEVAAIKEALGAAR